MKIAFLILFLIVICSVLLVITSVSDGDTITFAFSVALCILSTLGCLITAGIIDNKKKNR